MYSSTTSATRTVPPHDGFFIPVESEEAPSTMVAKAILAQRRHAVGVSTSAVVFRMTCKE